MNTPASIRQHPIHAILIAFPIGLWGFSLICDIIYVLQPEHMFWEGLAFYSIAGGIIGALVAAVPGFIDYLSLRDRGVKRIATAHMVLNLLIVVLYIFNLGVRYNAFPNSSSSGIGLSVLAIAILAVSGWLGGALVYEHRVGVTEPRLEPGRVERETGTERRAA
jgi:uncharacterized membrane protein